LDVVILVRLVKKDVTHVKKMLYFSTIIIPFIVANNGEFKRMLELVAKHGVSHHHIMKLE